jgi:hypothetical protein
MTYGNHTGISAVLNKEPVTTAVLHRQNTVFRGSGGVSPENQGCGFVPAFLDQETGSVYPARFADGRPAPMHLLDGLPDEVVVSRRACGHIQALKPSVIAGFLRRERFFTREQAARALRLAARIRARHHASHCGTPPSRAAESQRCGRHEAD